MNRTTIDAEARATPIAALEGSLAWLDLGTRSIEQWLDWQRTAWQPLLDLQARWLECWQNACGVQAAERGAEQLA